MATTTGIVFVLKFVILTMIPVIATIEILPFGIFIRLAIIVIVIVVVYVGQHYVHVDLSGQIFQLCVKFGGVCESVHHGIFPFSLLKLGRPQLSGSLSPVLLFHYTVFIGTVKPFLEIIFRFSLTADFR
tara:strand:- start:33 stop:419 length:387 start_codon:yes stop_codon:yes gene_type:complete